MDASAPTWSDDALRRLDTPEFESVRTLFDALRSAPDEGDADATSKSFDRIAPALIEQIASSADPEASLQNFLRIVESVGADRSAFYDSLAADAERLKALSYLAGWSQFLSELLVSAPGMVQTIFELFEGPLADERIEKLVTEGRERIEASGEPEAALSLMRVRELVLIAIRDLEGLEPMRVSRAMSAMAEALVQLAVEVATQERLDLWGRPEADGTPTRFAVLGCGKMGSGELVYGSDLDVIFVCDPGGWCALKDDRGGEEFWTRVAQRVIDILQQRRAFEVDTRLRPWGKQGPVVTNMNALRGYWADARDIWERLAMTRVAPIAGDPALGHEACDLIREAALTSPLPDDSIDQVAQMRARTQIEQGSPGHVKHGPGGYVDAEFVAQFLSLGRSAEEVPPGAAIEHLLLALSSSKVIPLEAAFELVESLRLFRQIEARLRLWRGTSESTLPDADDARAEVARRCGFESCSEFDAEVAAARARSRRWFEALIAPLPELDSPA